MRAEVGRAEEDRALLAPEPRSGPRISSWPLRAAVVVLVLGLLVTAAIAWAASALNERNEAHLLKLQTEEAGVVLSEVTPIIQEPLTSAVELAVSTGGDASRFRSAVAPIAGAKRTFAAVSLWYENGDGPIEPMASTGASLLTPHSTQGHALFLAAMRSATLQVIGPLGSGTRFLAYAVGAHTPSGVYVVFAQSAVHPARPTKVERNQAFSDLVFDLYLGRKATPTALLQASAPGTPLPGPTAAVTVPFASSELLMVAGARAPLDGWLSSNLAWLILLVGALISIGAAALTSRLISGRELAEAVALENAQLYSEQKDVAVTLQHALLPQEMPSRPSFEVGVRYLPGTNGVEIGGDWYDLIEVGDDELVFVIGDVSGRGLPAATIMASLRYSIRAYAMIGDAPATLLGRLNSIVSLERDEHFATVLCARIDIASRSASIANAGHLPPLLLSPESAEFVRLPVGPPIGVLGEADYREVTVAIPPHATLLAYTDGLVERPLELLDTGFERLRDSARSHANGTLPVMLDGMLADLVPGNQTDDDVAILGLRWTA